MNNFQLVSNNRINLSSDTLGAFASGLCLIHCLVTPLIFVVQACTATCCEAGPWWWGMIDYLFLGVSFAAIYYSAKSTSLKWMPAGLYITWGILALVILNESFSVLTLPSASIYFPAIALVGLHLYNRRYCQCHDEECCTTE